MIHAINAVLCRPRVAFLVGCACILDAANCVLNGHADWWVPTAFAVGIAAAMRNTKEG